MTAAALTFSALTFLLGVIVGWRMVRTESADFIEQARSDGRRLGWEEARDALPNLTAKRVPDAVFKMFNYEDDE